MRVCVSTPYPTDSLRGNSVSARRIARLIRESGHDATTTRASSFASVEPLADALIALHARKSGVAIRHFTEHKNPGQQLVILLTGTDLHSDLPGGGEAGEEVLHNLGLADRIIIAQEASLADLPECFLDKTVIIQKSVDGELPPREIPPAGGAFSVCLSAHLRPAKNPFFAIGAAKLLPEASRVEIHHYGIAESPEAGEEMRSRAASVPRYHWHGGVERAEVLRATATAHLALNTSLAEGGANALCEAAALGVPVLASGIPANIGMLGKNYPGYFPPDDPAALARLLERAEAGGEYLASLTGHVTARAKNFTAAKEREAWRRLLENLITDNRQPCP